MPQVRDVATRGAVYLLTLATVLAFASFPSALAGILTAIAGGVRYHAQTPLVFLAATSLSLTLGVSLLTLSPYTLWFADPLRVVSVPLWIPPGMALVGNFVVDLHWACTRVDLRRSALPGGGPPP